ncbi:MAG: DNA internalization-related competence protein ComEC/Rec2 [Chloroflexota bacterium]
MLIIYLTVCWLAGVWLASTYSLPVPIIATIIIIGLASTILWRRFPLWRQIALCIAVLGLGMVRYGLAIPTIDENHVAFYNGSRKSILTGTVTDEPDVRDRFVNLEVTVEAITLADGTTHPVVGKVQVQTFRFPVIEYGTRLQLNGRLETPPENRDFSYKDYLARQDIHSLMALPDITILAEGEGNPIYAAILGLKQRAQTTIQRLIPEPEAALLVGILLGNDNGLPPDLEEDFRRTGMTHIIAISGFNIAILVGLLVHVGEWLFTKRTAVILALVGVIFYTILVGADASVIRAAIMGSLYLVSSRLLGRNSYTYASLFAAAFAMTLYDPLTLWDVGFQLSFAATLSLMLYADPLNRWVTQRLEQSFSNDVVQKLMGVISESILVTLAAQILTLPLMIAYFKQLSLISLVANALILPAQPGVMIWGGLATILGLAFPLLGQPLAWVAWLLLRYTTTLVRALATVPGAAVPIAAPVSAILFIYALIALITWFAKQDEARRAVLTAQLRENLSQRLAFSTTLLAFILVSAWTATQPDGRLHVAFLDVGQGDAVFIQTPSGRQILVDGGFYPSLLNDRLGRQMPFWDRHLDMVVATHPDADHVSGLVGVFERYQVDTLMTEGTMQGVSPIFDEVLLAAEAREAQIHVARAGEVVMIGDGVRLEILHPGAGRDVESRNENSVSLRLVYGDFSLLLTGDAEERAETMMLQSGVPLQSLVFKAGHHGSRTSSTMPFLEAVRPQIVVVSSGAGNRFGHPHPEVLERLAALQTAVLRTDELGTITFITDGSRFWMRASR